MKTYEIKRLKIQTAASVITMVSGILLMMFKMYADSEPGAIPLLLIVVGTGGYFITRRQLRSQA